MSFIPTLGTSYEFSMHRSMLYQCSMMFHAILGGRVTSSFPHCGKHYCKVPANIIQKPAIEKKCLLPISGTQRGANVANDFTLC